MPGDNHVNSRIRAIREKLLREKVDIQVHYQNANLDVEETLQKIRCSFDLRDNRFTYQVAANSQIIDKLLQPILTLLKKTGILAERADLRAEYIIALSNIPFALTQMKRAKEGAIFAEEGKRFLLDNFLLKGEYETGNPYEITFHDWEKLQCLLQKIPLAQVNYRYLESQETKESGQIRNDDDVLVADITNLLKQKKAQGLKQEEKAEIVRIIESIYGSLQYYSRHPKVKIVEDKKEVNPGMDFVEAFAALLYMSGKSFMYEKRPASLTDILDLKLGKILAEYYTVRKGEDLKIKAEYCTYLEDNPDITKHSVSSTNVVSFEVESHKLFVEFLIEREGLNIIRFDAIREKIKLLESYKEDISSTHDVAKKEKIRILALHLAKDIVSNLTTLKQSYEACLTTDEKYRDQYEIDKEELSFRYIIPGYDQFNIIVCQNKIAQIDKAFLLVKSALESIDPDGLMMQDLYLLNKYQYFQAQNFIYINSLERLSGQVGQDNIEFSLLNRYQKFINNIVTVLLEGKQYIEYLRTANIAPEELSACEVSLQRLEEEFAKFAQNILLEDVNDINRPAVDSVASLLDLMQKLLGQYSALSSYDSEFKKMGFDSTIGKTDFPLLDAYELELKLCEYLGRDNAEVREKISHLKKDRQAYSLMVEISNFVEDTINLSGRSDIAGDNLDRFCQLFFAKISSYAEENDGLSALGKSIKRAFENWTIKQIALARDIASGKQSMFDILSDAGAEYAGAAAFEQITPLINLLKIAAFIPIAAEVAGVVTLAKDAYAAYSEPRTAREALRKIFLAQHDNIRLGLRAANDFARTLEDYLNTRNEGEQLTEENIEIFIQKLLDEELPKVNFQEEEINLWDKAKQRLAAWGVLPQADEEVWHDLLERVKNLAGESGQEQQEEMSEGVRLAQEIIAGLDRKAPQEYNAMFFNNKMLLTNLARKAIVGGVDYSTIPVSGLREQGVDDVRRDDIKSEQSFCCAYSTKKGEDMEKQQLNR